MSIVVFDSGVGGLTVLNELVKVTPYEDFIYLADEKLCPYGNRTDEFIAERLAKICDYINQFNPNAVVIACNTASRFKNVFQEKLKVPVFDVISPTVTCVKTFLKGEKVLLLATKSTVNGGVYQKALKGNNIFCIAVSCEFFVPYIENLLIESKEFSIRLKELFSCVDFGGFDAVIYGCTHFGLIDDKIKKILNKNCQTFYCGLPTALLVKESLFGRSTRDFYKKFCKVNYFTTASAESFFKKFNYYSNRLPNLTFLNFSCEDIYYIMI